MRVHGTIKKWDGARGFGFITPSTGGDDVFVHVSTFPRGVRPSVGDLVSFEIAADASGRRRAYAIQVPGARDGRTTLARAPYRKRTRNRERTGGWAPVALAAGLIGIGVYAYPQPWSSFAGRGQAYPTGTVQEDGGNDARAPATMYECDGRTHCSQMRSCEEARYFLAHCPNTQMDGDNDGNPCERQHCR